MPSLPNSGLVRATMEKVKRARITDRYMVFLLNLFLSG
jgi:hypothetical protein